MTHHCPVVRNNSIRLPLDESLPSCDNKRRQNSCHRGSLWLWSDVHTCSVVSGAYHIHC
jgi:hypothetical protein